MFSLLAAVRGSSSALIALSLWKLGREVRGGGDIGAGAEISKSRGHG